MWVLFATAISLGLVSSLHCVGMCGPLALALPIRHLSPAGRTVALLTYHGGRLMIYGTLGAITGLVGRHIYLAGFQQAFSIIIGALMLLWIAARHLFSIGTPPAMAGKLFRPLEAFIGRLWQSPSRHSFFFLGMANGLLPCGMVYLAVAGAFSFPQVWESIAFMFLFGAGTLPALLILSFSGRLIGPAARLYMRKAVPYLVATMGLLLILRGLDLGIPFVSPVLAHGQHPAISCH
ncbi:sulfite exporter TauE/SafE family protein [Flavitalea sp. BT771]|uniref:sulfite exporter TauE/SafE family protein n=1 Tax=Flavitalea sp. BT771 TaxID=3063329 RepID=UPI0026E13A90|nr:sulfite exporter TauE/SafE family protein [Flavitalea sp. BT771]MDO6429479.1 sulfite exporter TauE/SafE family protein [Flavitalea sp. BT771]MDV6218393.1 sulfite exporter TauE/SafE family protein [Flavitalea sp. BT771]